MAQTITRRDGVAEGLAYKRPVACATTANITLSAEQTIDGVVTNGSRVLVKNQTDTTQNGIYVSGTGAWVRALDFDGSTDFTTGTQVYVQSGSTNGQISYACTVSADPPVLGTSTITWTAQNNTIANGAVTNAKLANAAAWTFKGNNTSGSAAPTDFTIDGLTLKASPAGADELLLWDVAGSAIKKALVSSVTASSGVTTVNALAGALTVAAGTGSAVSSASTTITISTDVSYMRGYLAGLNLSNDAVTPNTVIDISAGVCASDDNTTLMKTAAITKTTAAWAVGSGNGGLDAGSVASSTWYHVYIIERTDTSVVDALISTSATTPTLPTNYTKQRRIGSFKTDGSSNILTFVQYGDEFWWSTVPRDVFVANPGTVAVTRTLTVPTGVKVKAIMTLGVDDESGTNNETTTFLVSDLSVADVSPSVGNGYAESCNATGAVNRQSGMAMVWTNTSAQLRTRVEQSNANVTIFIFTRGWVDLRGRFA